MPTYELLVSTASEPNNLLRRNLSADSVADARLKAQSQGLTVHDVTVAIKPVAVVVAPGIGPMTSLQASVMIAAIEELTAVTTLQAKQSTAQLGHMTTYIQTFNTQRYWSTFQNRVMWGVGLGILAAPLIMLLVGVIIVAVVALLGGTATLFR